MNDTRERLLRQFLNYQNGKTDWYKIRNSADDSIPSEIYLYNEIGSLGVTADDFINDLRNVRGPIDLHVNTRGGDVFDGLAIYSQLRQRGDVNVIVDSLAASIGSVIAMGGKTISMAPGSQMMIHDATTLGGGNAADMRGIADLLDKQSDNIAGIYAERTGKPVEDWRTAMQSETWYTAQEAVDAGLADSVLAPGSVQNTWVPEIRNADSEPYKPEPYTRKPDEDVKCPVCGKMNDSDAKYCDQCGTKLTGRTDVTEMTNAAEVDNSPWDASKAWHNGAQSDDPAAFYAGICAGKRDGDKSTQAAWALPYKYHPSDPPNAAGVRDGLSRLSQAEGLTNESEARATLQAAMKKINPDYEPPSTNQIDARLLQALLTGTLERGTE